MPKPKRRIDWGKEWKRWREANELTQQQFATVIGVSRRSVQNAEAGLTRPQFAARLRFMQMKEKHEKEKDDRRTATNTDAA